ncbi:MAG: surface carbohydrate biosynthesis protein [Paracoccaceae bacterium]
MSSRSLLLPVETLNREFDGKLLLALHAVERGWQATVGKRSKLHDNMQRFPRSIYFSKDFRAGNESMFRILSGLGHTIVGLDEEGLVNTSDEMLLLKMEPVVLDHLRAAFAWGENDARIYRLAGSLAQKPVVVTGNPRGDLLRPELAPYFSSEVAKIREKYGQFALFNTNFALVNHFIANLTRFKLADWVAEDKAEEMKSGLLGHKARLMDAFLRLVPGLAEHLHPHPLIIRPHPSENRQTWIDATSGLANVHVVHEGNIVAWLAAANVLIHNGCTSAVEASVLGTPALSYRPVKKAGFDNDLPNGLSREFEDADGLIAAAAEIVGQRHEGRQQLDPDRRALLDRHIAALSGRFACERLMDEIERYCEVPEPPKPLGLRLYARARLAARRSYRRVRKRSIKAKGNPVYLRHKFPHIGVREVNARIDRLSATLGRFDGYSAEEIMADVFRITGLPAAR